MARLDSVGDPVRIAQRGFRLLHFVGRTLRIPTGANKSGKQQQTGLNGWFRDYGFPTLRVNSTLLLVDRPPVIVQPL